MLKPSRPPDSAIPRSTALDLLRLAAWKLDGLAWETITGRLDSSMASRVLRSALWDMSISMPTRFISRITWRPKRLMPLSSLS
ncbi:hypothetical protein D9M73_212070 [compost metagenome]